LNDRLTAVVCANNQISKDLFLRAYELNIAIPDDLSVVGFDGIDNNCFFPRITTIRQNIKTMAQSLFDSAIFGSDVKKKTEVPVEIVIGESYKKIL
jgi:LacI family transcriptional regulator